MTKEPEKKALRVLVVDDHADSANVLRSMLRLHGHEAKVAYDGAQALTAVGEFRPDVVFLDLGLPMMSGYEVARLIKSRNGPVPRVVAITGRDSDEVRKRTAAVGFDLHLVKPVGEAQLLGALGP